MLLNVERSTLPLDVDADKDASGWWKRYNVPIFEKGFAVVLGSDLSSLELREAFALPLLRVPAGARLRVTLQSDSFIGFGTHWAGRQVLCAGQECLICDSVPVRSYFYGIVVVDGGVSPKPALLEVPAMVLTQVQLTLLDGGDRLRAGSILELHRLRKRGHLHVDVLGGGGDVRPAFRKERRLVAAAAVLYGVDIPGDGESADDWSKRVATQAATIAASRYASSVRGS